MVSKAKAKGKADDVQEWREEIKAKEEREAGSLIYTVNNAHMVEKMF